MCSPSEEGILFNPAFVLEFVVAPFGIDARVGRFDLFGNPFLQRFVLALLHHYVFQHLKIIGNVGAVAFDSVLEFHDGTDFLTGLAVHHAESLRKLHPPSSCLPLLLRLVAGSSFESER